MTGLLCNVDGNRSEIFMLVIWFTEQGQWFRVQNGFKSNCFKLSYAVNWKLGEQCNIKDKIPYVYRF